MRPASLACSRGNSDCGFSRENLITHLQQSSSCSWGEAVTRSRPRCPARHGCSHGRTDPPTARDANVLRAGARLSNHSNTSTRAVSALVARSSPGTKNTKKKNEKKTYPPCSPPATTIASHTTTTEYCQGRGVTPVQPPSRPAHRRRRNVSSLPKRQLEITNTPTHKNPNTNTNTCTTATTNTNPHYRPNPASLAAAIQLLPPPPPPRTRQL